MKKKELATLAMLGISTGLIMSGCQKESHTANKAVADEQMNSSDMQAFFDSLSSDEQKKFIQLDAQHKMMAIEMTQQSCNGENKCAGMGGCARPGHDCAGQNTCKGQGGPPVKDPNTAVEIQYNNQMHERQKANPV